MLRLMGEAIADSPRSMSCEVVRRFPRNWKVDPHMGSSRTKVGQRVRVDLMCYSTKLLALDSKGMC